MFLEKKELKILLRLPNWLGDSVMVSPSFEILKEYFPNATFSIVGSKASCGIYSRDSRISNIYIDETKKQKNRFYSTMEFAKKVGKHDIAIAFNNHFFSALFLYATKSTLRIGYGKNFRFFLLNQNIKFVYGIHQVLSYINLISRICNRELIYPNSKIDEFIKLKLISQNIKYFHKDYAKRYIGINAGAAYGSAKRWEEKYFVEVVLYFLKNDCIVLLFGNDDDIGLKRILDSIKKQDNNKNLINLVGKTDINLLCDYISILDLFITNDSGPMHIAASFCVPMIAIFGPTDSKETSPWVNNASNTILLDKHLVCAPCKKRECPLSHHNCMKLITPDEVIMHANKLLR